MTKKSLLETVCRRLLREAMEASHLAVLILEGDGETGAVLYDVPAVQRAALRGETKPESLVDAKAVVGYIGLKHHDTDCWAASEVVTIVGKGVGRLLYQVGFALSPSGILVMDREQVSPDAAGSWLRLGEKKKKRRLDSPPPNNATPETIDDCELHGPGDGDCGGALRDQLNWVYLESGGEAAELDRLKASHVEALRDLRRRGTDPEDLMDSLAEAAGVLFGRYVH